MTEAIDELGKIALALREEKAFEEDIFRRRNAEIPIKQRKQEGVCWSPIQVKDKSYGLGGRPEVTIERNPGDKDEHQFQPGTPIFLSASENEGSKGLVIQCNDRSMKIGLYSEDLEDWVEDANMVQVSFDSRSYKEMEFALNLLINAEKTPLSDLRERLIGEKSPEFNQIEKYQNSELNESQERAVQKILDAQHVAVIHGPPGTGKTTTLVAAVKALSKLEDQVLVCAPSNAAADLLLKKLVQSGLKAVRIGELSRMDEDIVSHSLDQLVDKDSEFQEVKKLKRKALELRKQASKFKRQFGSAERESRRQLYQEARQINKDASQLEDYISEKILDKANAIVCTLIGSSSRELRKRRYKTVCIDEAGQATEPATWVPILKAEKVVLAGDPFQLPPTVKSPEAEKMGLSQSLLDKIMRRKDSSVMLNVQYRMNRKIMQFSNDEFYNSELMADDSVADHLMIEGDNALEFIDTAGCAYDELRIENSSSLSNPGEAELCIKLLHEFQAIYPTETQYGIISPYKDQIRLLKDQLIGLPNLAINTVDGFQGQEKDVIILSLVRSNPDGVIGFLSDYRRMNVALTRAKKKLVVIGDSSTIGGNSFYSRFLEYVERDGVYLSAWEWMDT